MRMDTREDRLRWFVAFAGRPAAEDGQLQQELETVLTPFDVFVPVPEPSNVSEGHSLKGDLRSVLDVLTDTGDHECGSHIPPIRVEKLVQRPLNPKHKAQILIMGTLRDVVLDLFFTLVAHVPVDRIRRCPGLNCGRIFVKIRRQTHCTPACYDRSYWSSLSNQTIEKYRRVQYAANNWTRGARTKRLRNNAVLAAATAEPVAPGQLRRPSSKRPRIAGSRRGGLGSPSDADYARIALTYDDAARADKSPIPAIVRKHSLRARNKTSRT